MITDTSDYMLVFRESTPERYERMSQEETREALREWNGWCDRLANEGRLQQGHPLEPAARLVSGAGGERTLDGPFAEAKELIGGYFLITAADLEDATEVARGCPLLRYGMTVEIREVSEVCHLARTLGLRTMREQVTA